MACFCRSVAVSSSVPAYGILDYGVSKHRSNSVSSRKVIILHHDLHYHHFIWPSDFMAEKLCNRARCWAESLVTTLILLLDLLTQFLGNSPG